MIIFINTDKVFRK